MHGQDHESCTATSCLAYSTSDQTYTTRHVNEGCQCPLVSAPFEKIADVVAHGGIPLIDLGALSNDEEELRIVKGTAYSSYTAISQVWADGLGNAKANALPRCRLKRLGLRLSNLPANRLSVVARLHRSLISFVRTPSALLWMDTLCVPIMSGREGAVLRANAINRMAFTYSAASEVLILDEEHSNVMPEPEPRLLTTARMLSSKWVTRCWTLQEGALARKLFFQFEHPLAIDNQLPHPTSVARGSQSLLHRLLSEAVTRTIHADFYRPGYTFNPLLKQSYEENAWERFTRTWNDLGQRSTTKAEDIHVILANLNDFSAGEIMSLPSPVARTKAMQDYIGLVPLDILYAACPRPEAGANCAGRWIPSAPGPEPLRDATMLRVQPQRLVLDTEEPSDLSDLFVVELALVHPLFTFRTIHESGEFWYCVECKREMIDNFPRRFNQDACLVMERPIFNSRGTAPQTLRGALLPIMKQSSTQLPTLSTRYDCPLTFSIKDLDISKQELNWIPELHARRLPSRTKIIIEHFTDEEVLENLTSRSTNFNVTDLSDIQCGSILGLSIIIPMVFGGLLTTVVDSLLEPVVPTDDLPAWLVGVMLISMSVLMFLEFYLVYGWRRAQDRRAWVATFEGGWTSQAPGYAQSFVRLLRNIAYSMGSFEIFVLPDTE